MFEKSHKIFEIQAQIYIELQFQENDSPEFSNDLIRVALYSHTNDNYVIAQLKLILPSHILKKKKCHRNNYKAAILIYTKYISYSSPYDQLLKGFNKHGKKI